MRWAVETLSAADEITVDGLLSIHRHLLEGTRHEEYAGKVRTSQNWIGGSDYNPCSAAFVPPPEDHVEALLEDLCAFCNLDSLPAVAQAAIAHAQFETIHPFADGNGRTGRVLIHVVLRRRGLATTALPPLSLVLATWARDYVEGLTATRYRGPASSRAAQDGMNRLVGLFAAGTRRAVRDAEATGARVVEVQREWRERLGGVRKNSAADLLIEALPAAPIVTVQSAAALVDRSEQAGQRGDPPTRRRRRPPADDRRPAQPSVRGAGAHRRLHGPGAAAGHSQGGHTDIPTGAARARAACSPRVQPLTPASAAAVDPHNLDLLPGVLKVVLQP
jgi:Fic family protein